MVTSIPLVMRIATLAMLSLALSAVLVACGRLPASPSQSSSPIQVSCSLPVVTWTKNGGTSSSQSGFITVPSGAFEPDPTANGLTYDRANSRWLPVSASQALPDGSFYTYEVELQDRPGYQIHVVWVETGADKTILDMPYDKAYSILAMKPEGIYLVPILHKSGTAGGLWLLSSTRATLTEVPGAGDLWWQVIEGGAAWGRPADGDSLNRLDLSTGLVTTWFRHAIAEQPGIGFGYGPQVVGFDLSGRPLIEFVPQAPVPATEMWLVSSPTQANKLTGFPLPGESVRPGVRDTHGTWFVGADGFYLYTDTGFHRAAPMPPGPVGDFAIAGSCE
jgi:hypothetical protein